MFASKWPLDTETLWTVVNRNEADINGRQIELPYQAGVRYYDLYHGVELQPDHEGGSVVLSFDLEAHGYGAVLSTQNALDATVQSLMAKMKELTGQSLASYPHEWSFLPQQIVPIAASRATSQSPEGMVGLPSADYVFRVHGIELEGGDGLGVDVQYPWESAPIRYHETKLHIKPFWLDKFSVTNSQFQKFLSAAHYHPDDDGNFLKDWKNGSFPHGLGQ